MSVIFSITAMKIYILTNMYPFLHQIDGITDERGMNLSKLQEIVEDRGAWHATVPGVAQSETQLSKNTTAKSPKLVKIYIYIYIFFFFL